MIKDQSDIDFILSTKEKDITMSFIMENFADFGNGPRFNPYDLIEVPVGAYGGKTPDGKDKYNKNKFTTGVGRLIFNKFFFESVPELLDLYAYVNETFTSKVYKKILNDMGYKMMEGRVSESTYKAFCKKSQKMMPYVSVLAPNHSDNMLTITAKINKRKEQLLKEHAKELEARDEESAKVFDDISNELLEYARELMKDDPAMDMFDSGVGGSFENNFKNMFIMRGAVKDPTPNKGYNFITSNYMDGISREEYGSLANTLAAGPYARSKKTEVGGYWEKLFMSAFQHIVLLDEGSDCGTKRFIEMKVTDKNIDMIMYSYVIEGSNLVEITSENRDRFIGKKIKLRYSSMCEAKNGICNKCAGNLFYRLGIKNVGAATPQIPSKLKLLSMKLFHDDQLNFTEMDPMKAFCPDT
jgi:hypothetical protein